MKWQSRIPQDSILDLPESSVTRQVIISAVLRFSTATQRQMPRVCSVLGACIKSGDVITLICEGEDEEEAMEAMIKAIDDGLGE